MPGPVSGRPRRTRNRVFLSVLIVFITALSAYTFFYARGTSYLSDDPRACANCHIMRSHFDDWNRSSHKAAASCNSCHVPDGFLAHWAIKAVDGLKHSFAFTTGFFEEPIRITAFDRRIAAANCLRCHETITSAIAVDAHGRKTDCLRCHRHVGH